MGNLTSLSPTDGVVSFIALSSHSSLNIEPSGLPGCAGHEAPEESGREGGTLLLTSSTVRAGSTLLERCHTTPSRHTSRTTHTPTPRLFFRHCEFINSSFRLSPCAGQFPACHKIEPFAWVLLSLLLRREPGGQLQQQHQWRRRSVSLPSRCYHLLRNNAMTKPRLPTWAIDTCLDLVLSMRILYRRTRPAAFTHQIRPALYVTPCCTTVCIALCDSIREIQDKVSCCTNV